MATVGYSATKERDELRDLQVYHYLDREGSTYLCKKDNVLRILFLILMMSFLSHGVCGTPILDAFNEKFNHECKSKDTSTHLNPVQNNY